MANSQLLPTPLADRLDRSIATSLELRRECDGIPKASDITSSFQSRFEISNEGAGKRRFERPC